MKTVNVSTKEQLEALYKQSALTFEGLKVDEENLNAVEKWLQDNTAITHEEPTAHIITGALMNTTYELTGNNAYPDDLTIVSITGIKQIMIAIKRFEVGGRWFDDVVDNNARREQEREDAV